MTRRRSAAFMVLVLIASVLTIFVAPPMASADTATSLVRCTNTFAPTVSFNLPIDVTTSYTVGGEAVDEVQPDQQFDVSLQATIPLSEAFIAGVLAQVPSLTSIDVPRVFISIPAPAGLTAPNGSAAQNLTLTYAPGTVNITSAPGVPIAGGVALPSPTINRSYKKATQGIVDFVLDPALPDSPEAIAAGGTIVGAGGKQAAIEMDLAIFGGAVEVGFDCTDGGFTQMAGPDTVLGTPDDTFGEPVIPNAPFLSVPVFPSPFVQLDDVSGQVVNNAARAGNVITFSGANWEPGSNATVELCDLTETTCSADDLTAVTATIDASGVLDGSATIDASPTTGARLLRVTSDEPVGDEDSDTTSILILTAPDITAPTSAGVGAPLTVTGTGWNPNSPSTVVQLIDTGVDGIPNTADDAVLSTNPVVVDGSGGFTFNSTVVDELDMIVGAEADLGYPTPPLPGSLFDVAFFTVSADECTVLDPSLGCTLQQTLLLETTPGTLSMSQTGGIVDLGEFELDGLAHLIDGDINTITTIDATGSLLGWDLTATMTDLVTGNGLGNRRIPAGNLEWTPACIPIDANGDTIVDGSSTEVTSGAAAALDPTVARTLCTAASGGGGGTYTGDAALELLVPANVAAGAYQATMTFLLI